ncbi:MAG: helix-turn-helix transcriptional regulator [Hyphomicrobium sp.]
MYIPNLLEANRQALGLTQDEVGELLGLSGDTIGNYELAERSPGLQRMLGLELIYGRPLSQLYPDTRCAVRGG